MISRIYCSIVLTLWECTCETGVWSTCGNMPILLANVRSGNIAGHVNKTIKGLLCHRIPSFFVLRKPLSIPCELFVFIVHLITPYRCMASKQYKRCVPPCPHFLFSPSSTALPSNDVELVSQDYVHTMAVWQAYHTDLLKDLDQGKGLDLEGVKELQQATDLAPCTLSKLFKASAIPWLQWSWQRGICGSTLQK